MVLLFGYDEEGCEAADNIQPEQALTEQFPVFAIVSYFTCIAFSFAGR